MSQTPDRIPADTSPVASAIVSGSGPSDLFLSSTTRENASYGSP
jgi:hypothetical protein